MSDMRTPGFYLVQQHRIQAIIDRTPVKEERRQLVNEYAALLRLEQLANGLLVDAAHKKAIKKR